MSFSSQPFDEEPLENAYYFPTQQKELTYEDRKVWPTHKHLIVIVSCVKRALIYDMSMWVPIQAPAVTTRASIAVFCSDNWIYSLCLILYWQFSTYRFHTRNKLMGNSLILNDNHLVNCCKEWLLNKWTKLHISYLIAVNLPSNLPFSLFFLGGISFQSY